MSGRVLLYGASGYTGRELACKLAGAVNVELAGRSAARVGYVAGQLGLPWRAFDLDDGAAIKQALAGCALVINAAGPFAATAMPLVDGCIAEGVHYLDLAGEWPVFLEILTRDQAARNAGVMLIPGVGLTVAAGDCLMARAVELWPDTVRLCLGISRAQLISKGSVATAASLLDSRTLVRRRGELVEVPAGSLTRAFDFGSGLSEAVAMNWADVVTGAITTGVRDMEVYTQLRWHERAGYRASGLGIGLTGPGAWRTAARGLARTWPEGSPPQQRGETGFTMVIEAVDRWRRSRYLRMTTSDGYGASALSAAEAVRRVLGGAVTPGFQTPARVFGSGFFEESGAGRFEQRQGRSAA